MKLRPQFSLRFRDADHFVAVDRAAERSGISMNEYILRKVEANGAVPRKVGGEGRSSTKAVFGVSSEPANDGAGNREEDSGDVEAVAKRCDLHRVAMKDFGNKWACPGPPEHSEFK